MTSLVKWLETREGKFFNSGYRAYCIENKVTVYRPYYAHQVDAIGLSNELKVLDFAQQKIAITERNSRRQNVFHIVLNNQIYPDSLTTAPAALAMPWSNFKPLSNRSSYGKMSEKQTQDEIDSHSLLVEQGIAKPIKDLANEQLGLITEELLKPFKDDDKALVDALTTKDNSGCTPISYAYITQGALNNHNPIGKLEGRISEIKHEELKEALALATDKKRRNVFHLVSEIWESQALSNAIAMYGEKAALTALKASDEEKNNYLHLVCKINNLVTPARIQIICTLLDKAVEGEKKPSPTLASAFRQNIHGENPLHLATQNKDDIVAPLCKSMDSELRNQKCKEFDAKGYTPIHHAIKSPNFTRVRALLMDLSAEEKRAHLETRTQSGESTLHLACQYGGREVLEEMLSGYGPAELYKLLSDSREKLISLSAENPNMSREECTNILDKYDRLFNVYRYLEKRAKSNWFINPLRDNDFTGRLQHFSDALQKKVISVALPSAHGFFKESCYGSRRRYYDAFEQASLYNTSDAQLKQFKEFLGSKIQTNGISRHIATTLWNSLNNLEMKAVRPAFDEKHEIEGATPPGGAPILAASKGLKM